MGLRLWLTNGLHIDFEAHPTDELLTAEYRLARYVEVKGLRRTDYRVAEIPTGSTAISEFA